VYSIHEYTIGVLVMLNYSWQCSIFKKYAGLKVNLKIKWWAVWHNEKVRFMLIGCELNILKQ